MTSTIAGSSSMITIFAIRSAENISNLRKEKGETEKLCWFAADHHPRHLGGETDDRFICTRRLRYRRDCDHVCLISSTNFTQEILCLNGFSCIYRDHRQDFLRGDAGVHASKLAHLGGQAEIGVAGKTVGAEANVETEGVQPLESKWTVLEIDVAAGAMHNREHSRHSCQQVEIALCQFI